MSVHKHSKAHNVYDNKSWSISNRVKLHEQKVGMTVLPSLKSVMMSSFLDVSLDGFLPSWHIVMMVVFTMAASLHWNNWAAIDIRNSWGKIKQIIEASRFIIIKQTEASSFIIYWAAIEEQYNFYYSSNYSSSYPVFSNSFINFSTGQ